MRYSIFPHIRLYLCFSLILMTSFKETPILQIDLDPKSSIYPTRIFCFIFWKLLLYINTRTMLAKGKVIIFLTAIHNIQFCSINLIKYWKWKKRNTIWKIIYNLHCPVPVTLLLWKCILLKVVFNVIIVCIMSVKNVLSCIF